MYIKIAFHLILVCSFFLNSARANDCLGWFLKSGLAPKAEDCELKCSITPVDMGTFSCTSQCESLCSKNVAEQILSYIPRLTEGDRLIISKMPYEAYKVFLAKERVDKLTNKIFKKSRSQDESDAFRHFVWSVLLAQELGVDKAKSFLIAHEQDSTQSKNEKDMDLYNNDQGISYFIKNKNKKIELIDIEREALDRLRKKKLKVIRPQFKKIPGGYYSR